MSDVPAHANGLRAVSIDAAVTAGGAGMPSALQVLEELLLERDAQVFSVLSTMQGALAHIQGQLTPKAAAAVPPRSLEESSSRQVRWEEYQELIPRLRAMVRDVVPAGATVLVASKGDEELLRLPERIGWHFPRGATGVYAGHYPATSAAAIAHLEGLREQGASHLVIPRTALWWLDDYQEFRQHLESRYREVARRDDAGVIFALGHDAAAPAPKPLSSSVLRYQHLVRQVRELALSVLPAKATVLVVSKGDDELLKLPGCRAWHFPRTEKGEYGGYNPADSAAAIAHLEALRAKGADYLLFPATAFWWLTHYRDFRRHLENRCRAVMRQRHVCQIFELARK